MPKCMSEFLIFNGIEIRICTFKPISFCSYCLTDNIPIVFVQKCVYSSLWHKTRLYDENFLRKFVWPSKLGDIAGESFGSQVNLWSVANKATYSYLNWAIRNLPTHLHHFHLPLNFNLTLIKEYKSNWRLPWTIGVHTGFCSVAMSEVTGSISRTGSM